MDRRGWPWKKKSSDKIINADQKPVAASESVGSALSSVAHLGDQQDNFKNKNHVQISMESYSRISGLEDQVKSLEAKLSAAYSELSNKDSLVKQHAKVAEEAVSGWEKADAEVVALRHQLESITLSKHAVDDRASRLDDALKECTRQIRTVKEDSEQKLKEAILTKSQQWEKTKSELEAENAAILRSLQDGSNKIARLIEEKSDTEAEVELLKKNVRSYDKEIASLKYELHMISKEMDIRNEEKNIITRSAEVASKQHSENVKNIAKLETECQRLRSLLRKKLPGPAALAQMKLEVGISHQEFEFLTKHLEVLEEETKTLKEALAASNAELQASRNLYTKMAGRLKSLEAELSASKSIMAIDFGNSSSKFSNIPPSITSISDDGHEGPESPVESSRAASIPDLSDDIRRVTNAGKFESNKSETILELMDDFLEVEKMACLSDNGNVIDSEKSDAEDKQSDNKASERAEYMQDLKETKLMLQEKEQILAELKEKLASSHKSYGLAEIQLKCMTESYKSLQTRAEELEAQNKFLQEKIKELENDLFEQKQCHHDALVRYREIEEKMQRDKFLVCGSNLAADNGIDTAKEKELAAAEKKLAECQETLHILGKQLQALCPQMNGKFDKSSHGCSNSSGSCNSNDVDLQAEACSSSVCSEIQGANGNEVSLCNCGSASDTESGVSLNSSIGSSQPETLLTTGKQAHGLSHLFSFEAKTGH